MVTMEDILKKLKELKMKMADLENQEDMLPEDAQQKAEAAEPADMQEAEDALGVEKHDEAPGKEEGNISDDEVMEMFGKKKKQAPKPGMKIAIAVGAPKMAHKMGKYK